MSSAPGRPTPARVPPRTWIAFVLPPVAWFGFEVGLAAALRLSCTAVGGGLGVGWGGASLLACAVAAWIAQPRGRSVGEASPSPPWLAHLARLAAGLFALAIAFQTVATLIVPPCAR